MISPSAVLTAFDQTVAQARALVAYDPTGAEETLELNLRLDELHGASLAGGEAPLAIGTWYRVRTGSGLERYILATEMGAVSRSTPPPDVPVERTLVLAGSRPLWRTLNRRIAAIEAFLDDTPAVEQLDPGRPVTQPDDLVPLIFASAVGNPANLDLVSELRQTEPLADADVGAAYAGDAGPAQRVYRSLQERRSLCGVDGNECGHFVGAVELVDAVLRASSDAQREERAPLLWAFFHRPAAVPLPGRMTPTTAVQRDLAQELIRVGARAVVEALLDEYRSLGEEARERALNSETYDDHLWALYAAIPPVCSARSLAADLAHGGPEIDNPSRFRKIAIRLDEELVRIIDAFSFQLMDFEGLRWSMVRAQIDLLLERGGSAAAEQQADRLSRREVPVPARPKAPAPRRRRAATRVVGGAKNPIPKLR